MPAGPAVDDVIAWLGFRAWGAAIAFSPSRQRESEATHGFLLIRDAERRRLRRGRERQRGDVCVRPTLCRVGYHILQSLYHALCTFSGPYKCGLLAILINSVNFVFVFVFFEIRYITL